VVSERDRGLIPRGVQNGFGANAVTRTVGVCSFPEVKQMEHEADRSLQIFMPFRTFIFFFKFKSDVLKIALEQ
jgi:hypothetical protein